MKTKEPKSPLQPAKETLTSRTDRGVAGSNGKTRFSLEGVEASQVCVAGDFNGWDPAATPLQRNGDGRWTAEVELTPGRHEYLFVADGRWSPDPKAERAANPFGGENSVVVVPAAKS